jgi:peptidyl-prolyl cis-trans isomerase C
VLDRRPPMRRPILAALLAGLAALPAACNESALQAPAPDAGSPVSGLSAQQASRVLAKAGDRTITLADFAKAIERMDEFDRLRYQTKERRRELLNTLIDEELLAAEARRRGMDKEPETEDAIRAILRDAILSETRSKLPTPAEMSSEDVRAYYEAHVADFTEPERRRVAAIVMTDKKDAQKVLKEAQKAATGAVWGDLFAKHSINAAKTKGNPAEFAGDLGIVGPPSDPKGGNPAVPEAVRAAAFAMADKGAVAPDLIEAEGKQFILRLNGITSGNKRTLAQADRAIRMLLLQERMAQQDRALEDELRKKYPVQVDEQALAQVKVPAGMDRWYAMDSKMWPEAEGPADPAASAKPDDAAPDGGAASHDGGR